MPRNTSLNYRDVSDECANVLFSSKETAVDVSSVGDLQFNAG